MTFNQATSEGAGNKYFPVAFENFGAISGVSRVKCKRLVVIDRDEDRRTAIYRVMAPHMEVLPISSVAELGRTWPQDAWFLIHDDLELFDALRAEFAKLGMFHPIVMYDEELVASRMVAAIMGGALNYLLWPATAETMLAALSGVEELARKRCAAANSRVQARSKLALLSPRELQVLQQMRAGLTNKAIARELGISDRTVEIHRANAIAKLGVGQSIAATALLIEAEGVLEFHRAA